MRRTQIYLGEEQEAQLEARSRATGVTKSAIIRDAVDAFFADDVTAASSGLARMRAAVSEASGVADYLPHGAEYVDELRARDAARLDDLDRGSR
ncbi:MAG: ribbon-helix-helix protein, CopG family [Solirubrobacterales bacterium]|nr:ribbon-helix-helix protein, CopG family [Solirubrobacterales bacterium]